MTLYTYRIISVTFVLSASMMSTVKGQECAQVKKMSLFADDSVYLGHTLKISNARSVLECIAQCSSMTNCLSFHYCKKSGLCELNSNAASTLAALTSEPGCRYYTQTTVVDENEEFCERCTGNGGTCLCSGNAQECQCPAYFAGSECDFPLFDEARAHTGLGFKSLQTVLGKTISCSSFYRQMDAADHTSFVCDELMVDAVPLGVATDNCDSNWGDEGHGISPTSVANHSYSGELSSSSGNQLYSSSSASYSSSYDVSSGYNDEVSSSSSSVDSPSGRRRLLHSGSNLDSNAGPGNEVETLNLNTERDQSEQAGTSDQDETIIDTHLRRRLLQLSADPLEFSHICSHVLGDTALLPGAVIQEVSYALATGVPRSRYSMSLTGWREPTTETCYLRRLRCKVATGDVRPTLGYFPFIAKNMTPIAQTGESVHQINYGLTLQDPMDMGEEGGAKVYFLESDEPGSGMYIAVYDSRATLLSGGNALYDIETGLVDTPGGRLIELIGTGHIVFNRSLYFQNGASCEISYFDLEMLVTGPMRTLSHCEFISYSTGNVDTQSYVDMAVDATGLYAVYRHKYGGGLVADRLDPVTLETIESTQILGLTKSTVIDTFVIGGYLHVVHDDGSSPNLVTRHQVSQYAEFQLPGQFERLTMTSQNGQLRFLTFQPFIHSVYGWESDLALQYDVDTWTQSGSLYEIAPASIICQLHSSERIWMVEDPIAITGRGRVYVLATGSIAIGNRVFVHNRDEYFSEQSPSIIEHFTMPIQCHGVTFTVFWGNIYCSYYQTAYRYNRRAGTTKKRTLTTAVVSSNPDTPSVFVALDEKGLYLIIKTTQGTLNVYTVNAGNLQIESWVKATDYSARTPSHVFVASSHVYVVENQEVVYWQKITNSDDYSSDVYPIEGLTGNLMQIKYDSSRRTLFGMDAVNHVNIPIVFTWY
ncbi:uncharacterized protein LOC135500781 [Lineus longissimus]|uniref:uncharacterized protein LOC135500781 n=1 Tax=Lineus longissimus TaxID=88925 RepID=UPI00315D87FA